MFVKGKSRRSRVIDRKRKDYRWTDRPTDMCKAICPLFFEGGHKNSKEAKQVPLPDKVKHDCINYSVGQSVFLI